MGRRTAGLPDPPLEQVPLGVVVDQRQRATVRVQGLFRSTEPPQQLGHKTDAGTGPSDHGILERSAEGIADMVDVVGITWR
jgi:hypothetical protein